MVVHRGIVSMTIVHQQTMESHIMYWIYLRAKPEPYVALCVKNLQHLVCKTPFLKRVIILKSEDQSLLSILGENRYIQHSMVIGILF